MGATPTSKFKLELRLLKNLASVQLILLTAVLLYPTQLSRLSSMKNINHQNIKSLTQKMAIESSDVKCLFCGFVHELNQNTLCRDSVSIPKIEVLGSEKKPVYTITLATGGGSFSQERVSHLPPYLLDRQGNLLKKMWHRCDDAGYSEITSEYLSNIAVDSGLVIKLMAESLEISQACICGDPPLFIVDERGGVYKRDRLKLSLSVRYSQVLSEYLSNIVVVCL
jgi:hypothetical protein